MKKLVVALTAALVLVLLAIAWSEQDPEWVRYQNAYLTMARQSAQNQTQSAWYQAQQIEIRQITVAALDRVDRCTTCHLAVADPNFASGSEPLRTHSAILASHPPEQFGCTICHRGEGRAVTTLAGHGQTPGSTTRLLRGESVQAACYMCHGLDTLAPAATSEIVAGQAAMNQMQCLRCHQLNGMGESEGPDLSAIGSRRDEVELYAHLLNPSAITPGSTMPVFPLTREQARSITIYLLAAQETGHAVNDARYLAQKQNQTIANGESKGALISFARAVPAPAAIIFFNYAGPELFWSAGCGVCHRIGNAGGLVGPTLTYIGRTRDRDWLRRYLQDPAAVRPDGRMPQLYMNEREINALVEFLATLN